MNQHQQQGVVRIVAVVSTDGPPPYPPPPPSPPPPPPRRRLSLCRILIRAFIGACVFIGALALLIWLIYRPRSMQVAVATATLARFDLNATSPIPALSYNLTAVLAVSNPNRRVSIFYDRLQAVGFYQDQRFGHAALPVSFQGTRHGDNVPVVLAGSSAVEVSGHEFRDDSSAGVFPIDLWVDGVVRYKFGELTTTTATTMTAKCHLALQLMVASGWVQCTVIDF